MALHDSFQEDGRTEGLLLRLQGLLGCTQSIAAQSAETDGYGPSGTHAFSLDPARQYDVAAKQINWPS